MMSNFMTLVNRWVIWIGFAALIGGATAEGQRPVTLVRNTSALRSYVGFDRNEYPGDAALPALHSHFSFAGYWLTNPPGERRNGWVGKRAVLLQQGFGFLVLANGKLDKEILKAGVKPEISDARTVRLRSRLPGERGFLQ